MKAILTSMALFIFTMPALAANFQAVQITTANAARLVQSGPDAAGGIGDWFLTNGTLCAVISNVDHESDLSTKGGVLIDLGFCDRADDQYVAAQDLLDASRASPVDISRIDTAEGEQSAAIITLGGRGSVVVETRYVLNEAEPERLHISKLVRRVSDRSDGFKVYLPIGFNYHSMETFVLSSTDLGLSNGFKQEDFVQRGIAAFGDAARNADTIISLSPRDSVVPISYGWRMKSVIKTSAGERSELPFFALSDASSTAFVILSESFFIGDADRLGWLQLLQMATMTLDVGESIEIEEEILVGAGDDVASITDKLFPNAASIKGRVKGLGIVVHLDLADGTPFTHVHPNEDGDFSVRAPQGNYQMRIMAPGGRSISKTLEVGADDLEMAAMDMSLPTRVLLPRGEPMRLVFRGRNGTLDPDFQDPLTGFSVNDDDGISTRTKVSSVFLAGIDSDVEFVDLLPGQYDIYATRGIEFSLEKTQLSLVEGKTVSLDIKVPRRVLETAGYIAADFHVHSGPSMDNSLSTVERLRTFVAEHGEVMVASEHDTIFSFHELVEELKLTDKIVTVTGTEMTSEVPTDRVPNTIGHANFFPLERLPHAFRRGAPNGENRRIREVIHEMKRRNPNVIAQLNHGRSSGALSGETPDNYLELINAQSYLDHMGPANHPYNPLKPITDFPNNTLLEADPVSGVRDIDFDVMEIMNGPQGWQPSRNVALRRDWLSLLKQGIRIVAAANSDSHTMASQVGLPRNMVAMADDTLSAFDQSAFIQAIKAGNSYGTTGPMFELNLNGAKMGSLISIQEGTLKGRIVAADWVGAETLSVQVNGKTVVTQPAVGQFDIELKFDRDSFVTIEVHGEASQDYSAVYPLYEPYAFSNPIYVDADGDGEWTPPGL